MKNNYVVFLITLVLGIGIGYLLFHGNGGKTEYINTTDTLRYETKIYDTTTVVKWKIKKIVLPPDTVFRYLSNSEMEEVSKRYFSTNYMDSTLNFNGATLNFSGETYKNELQNTKFELQFVKESTQITNQPVIKPKKVRLYVGGGISVSNNSSELFGGIGLTKGKGLYTLEYGVFEKQVKLSGFIGF